MLIKNRQENQAKPTFVRLCHVELFLICIEALKKRIFKTEPYLTEFYLLPSNQEEVYSCQVDAELLTDAQQQVSDGHTCPQWHRATRAIWQCYITLPEGGAASSSLC